MYIHTRRLSREPTTRGGGYRRLLTRPVFPDTKETIVIRPEMISPMASEPEETPRPLWGGDG